jgi:hypothetical protein
MKKNIIINPVGLKGYEINERMKSLMGIAPINESKTSYVIELTKVGPDGKAYAIVRENHLYFIKSTEKTENLVAEDFNYIGGLKNKMEASYPSYAKAIKQLNLKFRSLAEANNYDGEINVFRNDNLLNENGMMAGFSNFGTNGFTGEGNLEGDKPLFTEEETKNNPWAICTASVGRADKDKFESCVKDVKKENGIEETITEAEYCGMEEEDVELSEEEEAIDAMLETEGEQAPKEDVPTNSAKPEDQPGAITERRLSIMASIEKMDALIDSLAEGTVKKKVYKIK